MSEQPHWSVLSIASAALLLAGACGNNDNLSTGKSPALEVPDKLSFQQTELDKTETQPLEIKNVGQGPAKIQKMKIVEEDSTKEFSKKNWVNSATIQPDKSLTVTVAYTPKDYETERASVRIKSNAKDQTVPLRVTGLSPDLDAPGQLNFPSVNPGQEKWRLISIQNLGSAPLELSQIQLAGNEPDKFDVTFPRPKLYRTEKEKDARINPPHKDYDPKGRLWPVDQISNSLAPGEELKVRVWFRPDDPRGDKAQIKLFSNDDSVGTGGQKGVYTINLTGNTGSPCLKLSHQDKISFKKAGLNNVATRTVTVSNCRPKSDNLVIRNIELIDDAGGVFKLKKGSLPGNLPNKKYTIQGSNKVHFVVTFKPPKKKTYTGKMLIESNDPSRQRHVVDLKGEGSDNNCPKAKARAGVKGAGRKRKKINTVPLETVQFSASQSNDPDGSIKRYEWSLIKRPKGSTAAFSPGTNVPNPQLYLDLAGEYKAELVVYDNDGTASCGKRALVTVKAVPQEDIHIQLVWDTPQDSDETDGVGADMDLHYKKRGDNWNEKPDDVFWWNRTADWGKQDVKTDDPSLDIDDTNGAGPENLNHNNPPGKAKSPQTYSFGVHYYAPNGHGPSYATVRVYIEGTLKKEFKNKYMPKSGQFWHTGYIQWPSKKVIKADNMSQGFP